MDIHPFPWHLTPMFHSNGTGVIPQQGMVITQTSTTLLSTPQNQRRTGQWANSALQLSFSNRKKSLKHFFFGPSVGFLLQCCWLSSSPALLGAAAQPQRSDALRDSKTLPAALSALLNSSSGCPGKALRMEMVASPVIEPPSGALGWSSLQEHLFSAASFHRANAQGESQPSRAAFRNTRSLDLSSAGLKCYKAKSQVVLSFKEQVPEDPTWEPKTHAPDWGKRPLQAQTGKPRLMDIFAPQHKPSLERLSEG